MITPMTFAASPDSYGRFMGRYADALAPMFADFAGITALASVLDVGCGPGALTEVLASRVHPGPLAAIDPAELFVAACRERVPTADVRVGAAEELPWPECAFDAALAQLVLSFFRDAPAAVWQMRRVVRPGGVVAGCNWAAGTGMQMVSTFWEAAQVVQSDAPDADGRMPYRSPAELAELATGAGLHSVALSSLSVSVTYQDFDDFWMPMLDAAGPIRAFCASLTADQRSQISDECRRLLGSPTGPFTMAATALAFKGVVG